MGNRLTGITPERHGDQLRKFRGRFTYFVGRCGTENTAEHQEYCLLHLEGICDDPKGSRQASSTQECQGDHRQQLCGIFVLILWAADRPGAQEDVKVPICCYIQAYPVVETGAVTPVPQSTGERQGDHLWKLLGIFPYPVCSR